MFFDTSLPKHNAPSLTVRQQVALLVTRPAGHPSCAFFFFFFPENLDERKQQRKKLLTSCIRTSHITNKKNTHVYGQFTTSMKLH